ncbi:uncharacterized protein BJX67DRAFT_380464 [Aspergillus lucknowensis]|uniref:Uncharacterized protein n=1 Tax=Aspergillus lucknowensis TaxID=176173 RepID=A0ABR4LTP3_9EURO
MIGDTKDFVKPNQMVKTKKPPEVPPSEFILGAQSGGDENADDLDESPQITFNGESLSGLKCGSQDQESKIKSSRVLFA